MINHANLVKTCGQCHPGAGDNFILGKVHLDVPAARDAGSVATRWVRWIYLGLIMLTIGAMAIHNALAWRKKAALKRRAERRVILRMTRTQRWQHWLLLVSFFVLAITGFALKYPDSWLGALLGASEAFRRIGHRAAGVILLAVGIFHVFYMLLASKTCEISFRTYATTLGLPQPDRSSTASVTAKRQSTGRWCGAQLSWASPA